MRGADSYSQSLFTAVKLEDFVPANHPPGPIRTWVNDALARMDTRFSAMYEADIKGGRPSEAHARHAAAGSVGPSSVAAASQSRRRTHRGPVWLVCLQTAPRPAFRRTPTLRRERP